MGATAKEEYRNKWGMDESIFPEKISSDMEVSDYKMVYYNPWDAQHLSYIAADYGSDAYQREMARLTEKGISSYKGYYGASGFDDKYELVAMSADKYPGFIYALSDGKSKIIYMELIFCNYMMDINYKKYISNEYLPIGFDATPNNSYRKKMLEEAEDDSL